MARSFSARTFFISAVVTFLSLITLEKLIVLLSGTINTTEKVDLKGSIIDRARSQRSEKDVTAGLRSKVNSIWESSSVPKMSPISNMHTNSYDNTTRLPRLLSVSWNDFISMERKKNSLYSSTKSTPLSASFKPVLFCPSSVERNLSKPMLSEEDQKWCRWALDSAGGRVVVGKSWGDLDKDNSAKEKFEDLNCNAYSKGVNPGCDDEWGDSHIINWKKSAVTQIPCSSTSSSKATCYDNENQDRFCVMENVQINFNMMRDHDRGPTLSKSRLFDKGFLSIDCGAPDTFLKWSHLFSTQLQASRSCDYVINGTTFVYSHDDVKNVGHTLNDVMNVWTLLWLTGTARFQDEITLLNIDAFNLGHNLNDNVENPFYTLYRKSFYAMLPGVAFGDKTVCLQRGVFQSQPQKMFIWDSWNKDSACSLLGPATLFQRWNLAARHAYGLLTPSNMQPLNSGTIKILLVDRKATENRWGNERTSRNILNTPELVSGIREVVAASWEADPGVQIEVTTIAFEKMPFEEQIRTVSQASILIGTHGAGLALALHMSVGTKYCCGVVEIFPQGEFFRIRGHGNMLRRTGVKYNRVDISHSDSLSHGVTVPVQTTANIVDSMLKDMIAKPACIRKEAYNNPYLDLPNKLFDT